MRFINLFSGHLLDHLFQRDRRVGITADGGQRVPHVSSHEIGNRKTPTNLIVPADTGLGTGMPLHRTPEIPFKGPLIVTLDPQTHGVHDTDQFFRIGIAGSRGRPELLVGCLIVSFFHQVSRAFDLGTSWQKGKCKADGGDRQKSKHGMRLIRFGAGLFLGLTVTGIGYAADLPPPLGEKDFISFDTRQAELGQLLFYDKILSGNRNISCGTCHHPDFGTSDGLSLGIGEGGQGLGPDRTAGTGPDRIKKRIPRNSPALWNLGAREIHTMFHDGRLSSADTYDNGFNSPAEEWLPTGFNSLLAVQAVFPLVAQFEMAGNPKENEIAGAVHDRIDAAWPILAKRVRTLPDYGRTFVEAFAHIEKSEDVTITDIANALAAFMALEWRSIDSPFDRYLHGEISALDTAQQRGLELFYGEANCANCHSGPLLSDQKFHALGLPPFGPGRTRRFDPMVRDVGRMGESDDIADAYRFRTPMLRNVALTAPYGHNGAFPTLEAIVRHHLDPVTSLANWKPADAGLPDVPWLSSIDFVVRWDRHEMARQQQAIDVQPVDLGNQQVDDLVAFLKALTGSSRATPRFGVPDHVPSSLAVD